MTDAAILQWWCRGCDPDDCCGCAAWCDLDELWSAIEKIEAEDEPGHINVSVWV